MAVQRVVRCGGGHGAGGLADFDGDRLAVGQGHGDRRTGHWSAHGGGVGDGAAFSRRFGGGQFDGGGIDSVGDVGHGRNGARHQVLEVAARGVFDGHLDLAGVLVDVIGRRRNGHGAGRLAGLDGDGRAVAQRHGDRSAGRIGQGCGVDDRTAFGHGAGGAERQVGGVGDIGHSSADRRLVGDQVLVVATGNTGDRVGQRRIAGQGVVRRGGGDGAGGLADLDGDRLAVGQSDRHRRAGDRRTDGGGISDSSALGHRSVRRQFHGRRVDGVGDFGHGRNGARHQVLEVAAGRILDGHLDLAGVLVDVVGRRGDGHGAGRLAGLNGDGRAVGQGHGHRSAGRIGQGCGVDDRTAFGHGAGGAERQVGGVDGVGDGGRNRRLVGHQVLVVAAGNVGDRVGQRRIAGQRVVRRGGGDGAGGLADLDGDRLAVRQGHGHRRTGHGCAHGGGVGDGAALSCRLGGGQLHGGGIDSIGDLSDRRNGARHQVLEIAAGRVLDGDLDLAGVLVDVVGRGWDGHGSGGLAGFDRDDGAVRQGHGDRRLGRVGQGRGVGDLAALGDRAGGRQAQAGVVDRVGDGGGRRRGARHQVLEIAAGGAGDGGADGAAVVVDVVRRGRHVDGAAGLAGFDGDGRAVGQGDGHRRLRRVGQGGGVGDLAAFGDAAGGGQRQAGGVLGVDDGGHGRRRVRHQVLEVAAAGAGDGGGDGAAVVVDVVRRGRHVDAAGGLAGADGDGRAVGQRNGHRCLRRVGQGGGVGDLPAFGDARPGRQGDGGGVDGVGDLGGGRGGRRGHGDAVAAGGAGDGHVDLFRVVVDGVVRGQRHVDGAGGGAGRDHDHRTVGQGDGQVGQRCLGHGRGVHQHAAGFGDGRRGAEGQGRVAQRVGGGVGGLPAGGVLGGLAGAADAGGREADGRIDAACGRIEHHEAVAAAGRAARACGARACGGGFKGGGRVGAGGDGLLQLFNGRRRLRGGLGQVGAGVRSVGAPLRVAAQVQSAAVGQLQGHRAGDAGVDLIAGEQPVAFNEHAAHAFRRHHEYLTDNAFDDGNNTAH